MDIETLRRSVRGTVMTARRGLCGDPRGSALQPPQPRPAAGGHRPGRVRRGRPRGGPLRRRQRAQVSPRGSGHNFVGDRACRRGSSRPRGDGPGRRSTPGAASPRPSRRSRTRALAETLDRLRARLSGRPLRDGGDQRLSARGRLRVELGSWGLACHNVESVEVVLADGSLRRGERGREPGDVLGGARRRPGVLRDRRPLPACGCSRCRR